MKLTKYDIPESSKRYYPNAPFNASVVANEQLTERSSGVDIRNIVLDISTSGIEYIEGQSIGIIPPGIQSDGKQHLVRLSIQSRVITTQVHAMDI